MKKILSISFGLLAVLAVSVSCNKVNTDTPNGNTPVSDEGKIITIKATLSDALTKVSFDVNYGTGSTPTEISHTWQDGDILHISNGTDSKDFTLVDGFGTPSGTFQGEAIEGSSFTVTVVPQGTFDVDNEQDQAKDGDTAHLKYVASATNVTDLSNITLSESSSIIGIIAKLPKNVAVNVDKLVIETSTDNFQTRNTLTVNLKAQEDIDSDDILKVYANVPTDWSIPANTKMLLKFGSKNDSHTVYTRYQEFPSGATIYQGEFNYLKLNCSHTDQYAGGDGSAADKAYLIGDKYQMSSVNGLMAPEKKYFKLLCDIDMSGVSWTNINPQNTPYNPIDFDGNGKTISNLSNSLFYVFKGNIKNLTLDHCTASNGTHRGIFAQYVQGDGEQTVTNVDVINGTVSVGSGCMGGLIGRINNPSGGTTTATITDCDVTNTSVTGKQNATGGLIGSVESVVTVRNTNVKGTTVTGNNGAVAVGGIVGKVSSASTFETCTFEKNGETAAKVTGPSMTGEATTSESSYGPGSIYVGGIAGEVSSAASFDDCHVKNATVTVNTPTNNTAYWKNVGGAFGYIHNENAKVGETTGCSVETVSVPAHHWAAGFVSAMGGGTIKNSNVTGLTISGQNFVGGFVSIINSGTISNCSVAGNAIQSANATIGGFVAYVYGVATLTDNSASLQLGDSTHMLGTNLGGFAGQVIAAATFEDCTASGNIYSTGGSLGGFAGYVSAGSFTSCHASGDVSTTGNSVGGLLGKVMMGEISKCSATGDINGNQYVGGIIGQALPANSTTVSISECYYSEGTVSSTNYAGGLVGITYQGGDSGSLTITNCYMAGDVSVSGQWAGGILGSHYKGTATLENCYDTGSVTGSFGLGGIVGYVNATGLSVTRCFPFNSSIKATNTDGTEHYSSGAVIGYGKGKALVVNLCYRVSDMASKFNDCTGNAANVIEQHSFIATAATIPQRKSLTYGYYHHGRNTNMTLCNLVHSGAIGEDWSNTIWDWSGSRPVLNNNKETL